MAVPPTSLTGASSGEVIFRSLVRSGPPESLQTQIRKYIVERGLQPGDRLPSEGDLASALGSSRLIIREALRALEAVGVLASRPGSGWYVRAFDVGAAARIFAQSLAFHHRALLDLLAVRRAAEGDLVASLAGRLPERDLAVLDDLAQRMEWRASRGEVFPAEDGEFHRRLLAHSGNLVALALVDLYMGVVREMYEHGLPRPDEEELPRSAAAHGEIVAALRRGDGAEAARIMRAHHDLSESRISAWAAQHDDPSSADATALRSAVQAALLWPGPG
jgi:GntR family transcriptional regulator, transcriptional repressor for pyruvate dehydrogenase complex